ILVVGHLSRGTPLDRNEVSLAIGMTEFSALIQARSALMAGLGAGPEQPVVFIDAIPGHAGIVRDAALGGDAQLLKYFARRGAELFGIAESAGNFVDDSPVFARTVRRCHGSAMADDAAFHVGRRTVIFFHQRACEHDVGVAGSL